jgi:hypothetical protein
VIDDITVMSCDGSIDVGREPCSGEPPKRFEDLYWSKTTGSDVLKTSLTDGI